MIEEIVKLRRKGLSFRKIAVELNSTVGKVQYQWKKHMKAKSTAYRQGAVVQKPDKSARRRPTINKKLTSVLQTDRLVSWLISADHVYVFWRLSNQKKELVSTYFQLSVAELNLVLRINDVTSILFDGSNAHYFHEFSIPGDKNTWLVRGLLPNRCYCAELGIKITDKKFFPLLRSNAVHMPRTSTEQAGELAKELEHFKDHKENAPRWIEHVSTYSFYENKEGVGE